MTSPIPSAGGGAIVELPLIRDDRGLLSFGEVGAQLPFAPRRYFTISNVPHMEVRGEHAHRQLHQFFVCLHGSCVIVTDDGLVRTGTTLDSPGIGLHSPPMTWCTLTSFTQDAVLLVLASETYRADDYIRDYEEFLQLATQRR